MSEKVHPKKESLPQKLARLSKDDLVQRDVLGRTLLHVIVLCNRHDLLRHLLRNPHIRSVLLLIDYESGWNVLHYIVFYRRIKCLKCLQDYLRSDASGLLFGDLIRCKDRSRLTPMQLVHNNFKDLVLVPTCINEKNEYSLRKRVPPSTTSTSKSSWWSDKRCGSEIHVLGANNNNNLGVGDSSDRTVPTRLSHRYFKSSSSSSSSPSEISVKIELPRYKEYAVSKYHSVVITRNRDVYTCGIGSYGRLGHSRANLTNQYKFNQVIDDSESALKAEKVAISNNHSVVLTCDGEIYGWGANNYSQLGNSGTNAGNDRGTLVDFPDAFEATPILINTGDLRNNRRPYKGVAVSKIHTLVYTDFEVYSWGLSIGQMGFPVDSTHSIDFRYKDRSYKGQFQQRPKSLAFRDEIKLVATCETCTCVITVQNDIHILANYQHIKLPKIPVKVSSDKHFDFFKPAVLTRARNITKVAFRDPSFVALLMDSGDILGVDLSKDPRNTKYTSIWKPYNEDMNVADMDISHDGSIVLCTRDGSVFLKNNSTRLRLNSISGVAPSFINTVTNNKFKRIDYVNKVVKVSCDPNFTSFGFIRDSIDALPLKVQFNEFFMDLGSLCCTSMVSENRKQDQLFDSEQSDNFYVTDFIYPSKIVSVLDDVHDFDIEYSEGITSKSGGDLLLNFEKKYDYKLNRPHPSLLTYKSLDDVSDSLSGVLNSNSQYWEEYYDKTRAVSNKRFDCYFEFEEFPNLRMGAHKSILLVRSKLCKKLLLGQGEYFDNGQIHLTYQAESNTFKFENKVALQAFLMLIHYIYTNNSLDIAQLSSKPTAETRAVRAEFERLSNAFQIGVNSSSSSNDYFLSNFGYALLNSTEKDLVVKLSDGEASCHSYILISRSAYFETLYSERWYEGKSELILDDISCLQFDIMLRYCYGICDRDLFNTFLSSFETSFEFVNFLLELTELAEQYLLLPLKSLCELAIKDMITLDNVLLLTVHASNLRAKKLFLSCTWFIYNNLELLIFELSELSYELIQMIEEQVILLSNCRKPEIDYQRSKRLEEWFEERAHDAVVLFVNDLKSFNENFMSDKPGFRSFEPLIDIKYDVKTNPADTLNKRRKSRKSSSVKSILNTASALKELRKSLADELVIETKQNGVSENAIEDNDFETVVYGRRKSSVKTNGIGNNTTRQTSPPATTSSVPMSSTTSIASLSLNTSSTATPPLQLTQKDYDRFPSLGMAWRNGSTLSLGSSGSPSRSNVEVLDGTVVTEENGHSQNHSQSQIQIAPRSTELKVANNKKLSNKPLVRLSQKQRKKLAQEAGEENFGLGSSNTLSSSAKSMLTPMAPWVSPSTKEVDTRPTTPEASGSSANKPLVGQRKLSRELESMPVLGKPKNAPQQQQPSLTEIMLEESLKNELKSEPVQKTFLEIQQEEEFNKWWQAEAARVQKEMGHVNGKKVGSKNKKPVSGQSSNNNNNNHNKRRNGRKTA